MYMDSVPTPNARPPAKRIFFPVNMTRKMLSDLQRSGQCNVRDPSALGNRQPNYSSLFLLFYYYSSVSLIIFYIFIYFFL